MEFKTPPSGGLKSNRPTGQVKDLGPIKTEGPMPWRGDTPNRSAVESDAKAGAAAQQSLEAALGEEITMQLWDEVEHLRAALKEAQEALAKQGSGASWSEVSIQAEETTEQKTPRGVEGKRGSGGQQDLRWTPNGTQVPLGSPPNDDGNDEGRPVAPPLPPFPDMEAYERVEKDERSRMMARFDDTNWLPRRNLQGEYWNMPVHRHERLEADATLELHQSRTMRDLAEGMTFLEKGQRGGKERVHYDRSGLGDGRALHPHDAVQGDGRALHGASELHHQARALHCTSDLCPRDRALQGASDLCHGDRALHDGSDLRHHGRALHGSSDLCHGGRALRGAHDLCHQDRALQNHPELCHGDRARQQHGPELEGDRAGTFDGGGGGDGFGMRYHGRDLLHHQLPNVSGSDPREKETTGLVERRERSPNDALRSTNPTLPKLPQYGTKTSSVDAADWIIEIQPIIGDMSNKATRRWSLTMQSTTRTYEKWLNATPLERLRLPAPEPVVPMMVGGDPATVQRLEQRITTLLLPSLPEELRQDLVANRELWPAAIMYKVLRTYQPGGWSERSSLLAELTQLSPAKEPMSAATGLRLWKRQRARAIELGAGLPDLMLQVRALDLLVSKILPLHPQALFRVSAFRMETHIDERPSTASLLQFHELLQAEMDTLVHSTPGSSGGERPSAKVLQQGAPQADKDTKAGTTSTTDKIRPCKFWGSQEGCRHAKTCKFGHAVLPDARERCWLCSSKEHRKNECPYGAKDAAGPQAGGSGGSGKSGKGETSASSTSMSQKSGNAKGKNGGGKPTSSSSGEPMAKEQGQGDPKVASVGSALDGDAGAKASTGGSGDSGHSEAAKKESELMDEVTTLLRSLRAAVKVCSIKRISGDEEEVVLLDGGATHCLRSCESDAEWAAAKDIKVSLAEGETLMKQLPDAKTLLTKERVQPIVPVSMVTMLGYKINWTSDGCTMHHPEKGGLPITLVQGCPTVPSKVGRVLMKEIEEWHKQQCKVRSILAGEEKGHSLLHQRLEALRDLFPAVPSHLLQQVPGKLDWHGSALPLNRRQRRSIERSKTLVIYAFSGPDQKDWMQVESKGVTVLCLDLLLGHNLLDSDLCGWIESLIETRGVDAWLLSPPCRTTSACRHRDDGGPVPLRGCGDHRFGLPGLKPSDQEKTDSDSILWLKSLYWMWLSHQKNPKTKYLLENPRDPNEWHPSGNHPEEGSVLGAHGGAFKSEDDLRFPSFWQWPESEIVRKAIGLTKVHVEQGAMGHPTVKPTTLMSNFQDVIDLQGLKCDHALVMKHNQWPSDVEERVKFSKTLAAWAPGLKELLAKSLVKLHLEGPSKICRLTPAEVEEIRQWEEHVARGHCPYRRDCAVCVETRGRDRKHTRQDNVDAFCLSLDVSGPYEVGLDQSVKKPRYYLTGNLTIPISGDIPLVEGLRELGMTSTDISAHLNSQLPLPSSTSSARPIRISLGL